MLPASVATEPRDLTFCRSLAAHAARRALRSAVATGCLLFASNVAAQSAAPSANSAAATPAAATPAATATANPAAAEAARAANPAAVDPFLLKVRQADSAYLARDFAGAVTLLSEAIQLQPRSALGHLRLGEALRAQDQWDAALAALSNAERFAATPAWRARILLVIADTHERAGRWVQAQAAWQAALQANSTAANSTAPAASGASAGAPPAPVPGSASADVEGSSKLYPETAQERSQQLKALLTRVEQYAAVKARIEQREAEVNAKTRGASSSKPSE